MAFNDKRKQFLHVENQRLDIATIYFRCICHRAEAACTIHDAGTIWGEGIGTAEVVQCDVVGRLGQSEAVALDVAMGYAQGM